MKLLIIFATFAITVLLFYYAAGTLSLSKLNIISFSFYNILFFSFIGASIVFLGFREHYLIEKINDELVVWKTYLFFSYACIIFPLSMIFFNFVLMGKKIKKSYNDFLYKKTVTNSNENKTFVFIIFLSLIGIISMIYVFYCIGFIPILHIFNLNDNADIIRININRNFSGNPYIKNLIFLTLTPLLSYLSYIYFRLSHKKIWGIIFFINLFMSLLIKTYDFSKAPVIYYLFYFYIIEILLGNKKIFRYLCIFAVISIGVIYFQYMFIMGYDSSFFTLSSGPLGRIIMTQISTLFLHVQAFPDCIPFLNGASFPTIIAKLIGNSTSWVRSGREVMKLYNPIGVSEGIAGSMNAFFIGEAYANWGTMGVLISPIIVAASFSIAMTLVLKMKKTPLSLMIYISLFISLTESLQGGFVEYIYNISAIITILAIYSLYIFSNKGKIGMMRPLKYKRFKGER